MHALSPCEGPVESIFNFIKNPLSVLCGATTATAERCFSILKLIKTPLRSTMLQEHLNQFMMLALNPTLVDNLCTKKIAEKFISQSYDAKRQKLFGK